MVLNKKTFIFLGLLSLAIISYLVFNSSISKNADIKDKEDVIILSEANLSTQMSDNTIAIGVLCLDEQGFIDLKEMKTSAKFVIVGTVKGVLGTVNLARNIYNTNEPDHECPAMANKYLIVVEDELKGKVNKEIVVTQLYSITDNMGNVNSLVKNEIPLEVGSRYILFLYKNPGKTKELSETYFGIGDPWQIKLSNGKGKVINGNKDLLEQFKDKTDNISIQELKIL